jgi:phosphoribulokinase
MAINRFPCSQGFDFPCLLNRINGARMSCANTVVVPGGKMALAMHDGALKARHRRTLSARLHAAPALCRS